MNLSRTYRQAIALTEELLREALSATFYADYTYEIVPSGDVEHGWVSLDRAYQVSYRNFEVKIRLDGDPVAFVEITLIESFVSEYGWQAMVVFTDSHSMCGSSTFSGKLSEGRWHLRPTRRIAYTEHDRDVLVWDPYWLY